MQRRGVKRWLFWLVCAVVALGIPGAWAAPRRVVVGGVTGGAAPSLAAFHASLQRELATLAGPDLEVVAPGASVRHGGGTPEGMALAFHELETDPDVSLGVALGYVASGVAAQREAWGKPMLATHLLVPPEESAALFSAIVVGPMIRKGLARFFDALPLSRVTLVVDERARPILSEITAFAGSVPALQGKKWRLNMAPAEPEAFLEAVPEGTQAVIVSPFPGFSPEAMEAVARGLARRGLPSYAMGGRAHVEAGLLFSSEPGGEVQRLARRTALTLYSMARGESLGLAPDAWAEEGTPVINMATAKAVGFAPGWGLFRDAVKVGVTPPEPVTLTLAEAMTRARLYNPDLASAARLVEARAQEVNKALSHLVPRLDASVTGVKMDRNSAEKSMGTESEESIKGSLTLTQVLYSEKAMSGYSALKRFQRSREAEQQARALDKALAAGEAYIVLRKVQSLATVREANLVLTLENLARARARKQAGTLNPSELFRWESEVAKNRTSLLETEAQVRFAENALKRLCGIPLTQAMVLEGGNRDHGLLLSSHTRFQAMMDRPADFTALVTVLVDLGWEASPERQQVEYALDAGRRRVTGAKRAFYLPEVALKGVVTDVLDRHGYDRVHPPFEEREWHVAIQASFPLVTGGERVADLRQLASETASLALSRQHLMALLAEKTTDAALAVHVTRATIELSAISREAAEKNLALVTDAYVEGAVPVIALLDAQNTALKARIASENAFFDFMTGMLRLQRLLGRVDLSGEAGEEMVAALAKRLPSAAKPGG